MVLTRGRVHQPLWRLRTPWEVPERPIVDRVLDHARWDTRLFLILRDESVRSRCKTNLERITYHQYNQLSVQQWQSSVLQELTPRPLRRRRHLQPRTELDCSHHLRTAASALRQILRPALSFQQRPWSGSPCFSSACKVTLALFHGAPNCQPKTCLVREDL